MSHSMSSYNDLTANTFKQILHCACVFFLIRCVVMVGLPYPNIYSAELKEKMAYLDSTIGVSVA